MAQKRPMTKATQKDIEYALQYGGETLMKTISHDRGRIYWTFSKSGRPVDAEAAQRFMSNPRCMPMGDGLFGSDSQTFGWNEGTP